MAKQNQPAKKPVKKPDNRQADPDEDPDEDPDDEDPDDEDQDAANKRINAIVTSRVNRAMKPIQKQLGDITKLLAAKNAEAEDPDPEDPEDQPESPGKKKSGKPDKQLEALHKRVKDSEDRALAAERLQKEQAEKATRAQEDDLVRVELVKHGITDPKLQRAAIHAMREDGFISRDEDTNKVKIKITDKYGTEDFVDPIKGVEKWAKADGKSFIPAVNTGGSGATPPNGPGSQHTKTDISKMSDKQKAAIELERASQGLPALA